MGALLYLRNTVKCVFLHINLAQPYLTHMVYQIKVVGNVCIISCNGVFLYDIYTNPLNAELNPICYLLALLGAHDFLHVSRIRVKSLTFRLLMSYIHAAPILDVSRSHTMHHSR